MKVIALFKVSLKTEDNMKKIVRNLFILLLGVVLLLCAFSCDQADDDNTEPTISKEVVKIPLDYDMTYTGNSLKDLSFLFDEQDLVDPYVDEGGFRFPSSFVPLYDYDNDKDIDDEDYAFVYEITADLEVEKHIDCVYIYTQGYKEGQEKEFTVEAGTPFAYEFSKQVKTTQNGWTKIEVDKDTQYLNFKFTNGEAPYEIYVYGYDLGKAPAVPTEKHETAKMDYLIGINGHSKRDNVDHLSCASYYRDYYTWTYSYNAGAYESGNPGTTFINSNSMQQAAKYKLMVKDNILDPVPCFMFDMGGSSPALEGSDRYTPEAYVMYGEMVYQFALRYGKNENASIDNVKLAKNNILKPEYALSLGYCDWIELGNEPNGEGDDGFTPYQLAALTSCAIDGHQGTVTSKSGSLVGAKVADPNMKLAVAGLAGIQTRYTKALAFWLQHNRKGDELGIDAFNVHTYCRKVISYNGYAVEVGVSPEEADLEGQLKDILEFRDKYYPNVEVWLTEFGWDTNQSYQTEGSSHAYGQFTGREVQGIWLVRAYMILDKIGVDRAAMYMCYDVGNEENSVGKYGTSGVITSSGEKKESFYYIYTLRDATKGMRFVEEIDSGNDDVWIYKFADDNGNVTYSLWCPTMDDIRVDDYAFDIGNASNATLIEMEYGENSGVKTELTIKNGKVTLDVSEKPIFVTVKADTAN